jgi:hypothetical protein
VEDDLTFLPIETSGPSEHYCAACAKTFLTKSGHQAHNLSVHGSTTPLTFVCSVCDMVFHDVAKQVAHLKKVHGIELLFPKLPPGVFVKRQPPRVSARMTAFAERHGLICYWCDQPVQLNIHGNDAFAPTREHLIPKALGGRDVAENLVLAHRRCNSRRGIMSAEAYRRLLRGEALTARDLWPE